jgi:TPR repeat protein
VAAHKPSPTPDQLAQAERLLEQGRSSFGQGNISVARQYFSRAADLGLPIAALRMAETYDPHELERAKVHGPKANAATAAQWYRRAAQFGVPEAEDRLRRLGGQ